MHIHILGICGTFMGGLAQLARSSGHRVSGCDANVYPPMSDQLVETGIELIEGFGIDQLRLNAGLYVIGNVVTRGNPLMEAILERQLPFVSGPQWLAEHVLRNRHVLAVAGTHGKTTATSMLASVLASAGRDAGFLVGGVPQDFGRSARLGSDPAFVIEADEYDTAFFDKRSKFVHYLPRTAVLNNLEFDHADIFPDLAAIETQFHHFVRTLARSARVVVNAGEPALARVLGRGCWSELVSFGDGGDWQVERAAPHRVLRNGTVIGELEIELPGHHNRMNALAALVAAGHVGIEPAVALKALQEFKGVKRRLEERGTVGGVTVIDDFAHHPTAIRETIAALRGRGEGRIVAILEPRSNTMKLGAMRAPLSESLAGADRVFCYAGGVNWDVAEALSPLGERVVVLHDLAQLADAAVAETRAGDRLLVMSNGGFGGIHGKLLDRLRDRARRLA
ncbi:MAG: UDP-N-acetylmuramate:L-alanyl-gamma-D-glutamyl-meso-diaminopimelate ligase [Burkholderiaceae bacterium]